MVNTREIKYLHPTLQRGANELVARCKKLGLEVTITQTLRDIEYQNKLFAQGRTTDGNVVTNARGGESFHNYGLAFDICKNKKGHEYDDAEFFKKVGQIWVEMGGTWGGNFQKFKDMPHFEFSGTLTIKDLQKGKTLDENVKMKWEEYMEAKREFEVDGEIVKLNGILHKGRNFVELRELTALGLKVGYDNDNKLPVINTK